MISVLVGLGLFAVASRLKVLDPITKRAPSLTCIGLALVSILATILKPDHMFASLVSILRNIFLGYGNWGLTWYVVLFLALYFARRHATERHWLFMVLVSYVLLVYSLAFFSIPYHIGDYDSANRLMLQVLPLVLLYLSLRFAQI